MLKHRFKDKNLYSQLVDNISRAGINYIFHKTKQPYNVSFDSSKCGYTFMKIYGLPCACLISKNVKLDSPIRMDKVYAHWKRLRFDDDGVMKDSKSNISILTKWKVIQERFLKVGDDMKLHIKKQLRKIDYPKTTNLKPFSQLVKTKGAHKKVKPTPNDIPMMQPPYIF